MQAITRYRAFDGREFDTSEGCREYENLNVVGRMIGLAADQVTAALERTDPDLADAIEKFAGLITKRRYEMGEKRRIVKGTKPAVAPEAGPPDEELAPDYRGRRDFAVGKPGITPDDLKDKPEQAEKYMAAWDAASVAAGQPKQVAA